jgi:hypothetical protein
MPLAERDRQRSAAYDQLIEDGYCVVDGRLPDGALARLRRWSDDWIERTRHTPKWKYQGSDIKLSGIRTPAPPTAGQPKDGIVDFLIEHPAEIMRGLWLDDFRSIGTFQIISKPPHAPALYWHQDWMRWDDPISLSPWPQTVFLNWYLTDTNAANGCLRAIPGSHRRRLELHEHLVPPHEGGGYDVEETNEWMFCDHRDAVDVPVTAGQLMIGDARLLHGTHPNTTAERRTVLLGWYNRVSNDVPSHWAQWGKAVPSEIAARQPDLRPRRNRQPGEFLR